MAGLTDVLQEDLFGDEDGESGEGESGDGGLSDEGGQAAAEAAPATVEPEQVRTWSPGHDVVHDQHGPGWVWGSGLGRVTVRFETAETGPGPVRTFAVDDPALHR